MKLSLLFTRILVTVGTRSLPKKVAPLHSCPGLDVLTYRETFYGLQLANA